MQRATYTFGCPICGHRFTYDAPGEPMCTGPSQMRNDHEPALMRLLRRNRTDIHPAFAERRAAGPLILTEPL